MYVSPRWSAVRLARFYGEEYRALYGGGGGRSVVEDVRWVAAQRSAIEMARFLREVTVRRAAVGTIPTVVEIGAGGGWNLAGLPDDWHRIGYDLDAEYLEAGRREFGVQMRLGFLDQGESDIRAADVVLLSHVVEHLADPQLSLKRIAGWLKPGSCVVIEVPGIFRIHQTVRDPMAYMQNAHLYTFCAETVARVCRSAKLRVLHVDEWCRVVAENGQDREVPPDPALAQHVSRYLVRCESLRGWGDVVERLPWIGTLARRILYRVAAPLLGMSRNERVAGGES